MKRSGNPIKIMTSDYQRIQSNNTVLLMLNYEYVCRPVSKIHYSNYIIPIKILILNVTDLRFDITHRYILYGISILIQDREYDASS